MYLLWMKYVQCNWLKHPIYPPDIIYDMKVNLFDTINMMITEYIQYYNWTKFQYIYPLKQI